MENNIRTFNSHTHVQLLRAAPCPVDKPHSKSQGLCTSSHKSLGNQTNTTTGQWLKQGSISHYLQLMPILVKQEHYY